MSGWMVRSMMTTDWSTVAEIYKQGIQSHKATFAQTVPSYEEWDENHMAEGRLVALDGSRVIGWIALTRSFARGVYSGVVEVSLYVDEGYQRKGVGTELLKALDAMATEIGVWTLEALIFADNIPSLRLFEKCGYRLLGVRERLGYDIALQQWRDVALLEKRL